MTNIEKILLNGAYLTSLAERFDIPDGAIPSITTERAYLMFNCGYSEDDRKDALYNIGLIFGPEGWTRVGGSFLGTYNYNKVIDGVTLTIIKAEPQDYISNSEVSLENFRR